jgi:protoporphyrinogen oxidase
MSRAVSRREMLALLLGAPLAAEACRFLPRRHIEGTIRGASMDVGHKLRDATVERAASGPPKRVGVAIVGAGPSGLSAAWRLDRLGEREYVVFDLEPEAGGTSVSGRDGVVPYPWGAHYVPLPTAENRALVSLLGEMGVLETDAAVGVGTGIVPGPVRGKETVLVREPEERLFIDGAWHQGLFPAAGASPSDHLELTRFTRDIDEWVGRRDSAGRRAFTIPVAHCSTDSAFTELDRISAATYLEGRGYRSKRLLWYVDYACRDDYGLSLHDTSAWAMLFYFAARVPAPGQPSAPFLTWPEGNGRLVRHLSDTVGDRLLARRLVTDIVPREDGVELAVMDVRTGTLARYLADHVIFAAPKFVAPRIVRPFREQPSAAAHLGAFTYGSWMVANLHLRARPRSVGFPFAWDNVLYDSPALGYVVATHQALRDNGPTIWTYYRPFTDQDPKVSREKLAAGNHADIADAVLADLARAHEGLEEAVERIDVWKWGHAMVRPTPGTIWSATAGRLKAAEPLGRLHFAHSDLSGLALFEEAQYHGVRAAEAVMRARGRAVVDPFI